MGSDLYLSRGVLVQIYCNRDVKRVRSLSVNNRTNRDPLQHGGFFENFRMSDFLELLTFRRSPIEIYFKEYFLKTSCYYNRQD